jgi:hypothetical protein
MTALAIERSTIRMDSSGQSIPDKLALGVAANVVAYQGGIACVGAAGWLVNASSTLALRAVGRWSLDVNTTGGTAGATIVEVDQGVFKYANSTSADLIAQANVGQLCYVVDDQTVALTNGSGTRSPAGIITLIDPD